MLSSQDAVLQWQGSKTSLGMLKVCRPPGDFGMLTVSGIPKLAKRMKSCSSAAQCVALGTVQIEKPQALVWWC
jgi:hypothetical protein